MTQCSLYKIDFPSGKSYIGISKSPQHRWRGHLKGARRGGENAVHRAIRKYGPENVCMRVLVVGPHEYIKELEIKAIAAYNTLTPHGYNITIGGDGVISPDIQRRVGDIVREKWRDVAYREKMCQALRDRVLTSEQVAHKKATALALWQTSEYRAKMQAPRGPMSLEHKRALIAGQANGKSRLGHTAYNNGVETKFLQSHELIPNGFVKGRVPGTNNGMQGRMWVNDGTVNKCVLSSLEVPTGFSKGRIPPVRTLKQKAETSAKLTASLRKYYSDSPEAENTRKLISAHSRGKTLSEETKKKISLAHTGMRHTETTRELLRKNGIGRKHSEEAKAKTSASLKATYERKRNAES